MTAARWVTAAALLATSAARSAASNDVIVGGLTELDLNRAPPRQPEYSWEEELCATNSTVYAAGGCYPLGYRGPCSQNELLLLDPKAAGIRAACVVGSCGSSHVAWPPTGPCQPLGESKLCPKRATVLARTAIGVAACRCAEGPARAMAANGACYEIYSQGFCDEGFVVMRLEDGWAGCVRSMCPPGEVFIENRCYALNSVEPCMADKSGENRTLTVDKLTGLPVCLPALNPLALTDPEPFCAGVDHRNNCTPKLTFAIRKSFLSALSQDKQMPPPAQLPRKPS